MQGSHGKSQRVFGILHTMGGVRITTGGIPKTPRGIMQTPGGFPHTPGDIRIALKGKRKQPPKRIIRQVVKTIFVKGLISNEQHHMIKRSLKEKWKGVIW